MSKLKISLYLSALFLAGVITGAILTAQVGKRIMLREMRPDTRAARWQHDLETRLSLSAEQSRKIAVIIHEGVKDFGTVLGDQASAVLANCNTRIKVELTPEQNLEFAKIEKEQQEFIRSRFNQKASE